MNLFEQAARLKLRFNTQKGNLTVEDLWDIPLTSAKSVSLDGIARGLNRQLKDSAEESFVATPSKTNLALQVRFDVVKHVIAVRLSEREAAKNVAANKMRREKVAGIIAKKQDAALENLSIEELEKLL